MNGKRRFFRFSLRYMYDITFHIFTSSLWFDLFVMCSGLGFSAGILIFVFAVSIGIIYVIILGMFFNFSEFLSCIFKYKLLW